MPRHQPYSDDHTAAVRWSRDNPPRQEDPVASRCAGCGQFSSSFSCTRCATEVESGSPEVYETKETDPGLPHEVLADLLHSIEELKAGREPENDFEDLLLRAIQTNRKRDEDELAARTERFTRILGDEIL